MADKKYEPPPLTKVQEEMLRHAWEDKKMYFGIKRMWNHLKEEYGLKDKKGNYIIPHDSRIAEWLQKQPEYQKMKRPRKHRDIRPQVAESQGLWQMDYSDVPTAENGYKYLFVMIDVMSKFIIVKPTKAKSDKVSIRCVKEAIRDHPSMDFRAIRSDNGFGKEFTEAMKELGINHFTGRPHTPMQQGTVERMNQTLKRMLSTHLLATGKKQWVSVLPQIVSNINNTKSFATDRIPAETPKRDKEMTDAVKRKKVQGYKNMNVDFQVGDQVRVRMAKLGLKKGATHKEGYWSDKVYSIAKVVVPKDPTLLPKYVINERPGRQFTGYFSPTDIQKVPPSH